LKRDSGMIVTRESIMSVREEVQDVLRMHAIIASVLTRSGLSPNATMDDIKTHLELLVAELERRRSEADSEFTEKIYSLMVKHGIVQPKSNADTMADWGLSEIDRMLMSWRLFEQLMFSRGQSLTMDRIREVAEEMTEK
jgi:hypothetical protein